MGKSVKTSESKKAEKTEVTQPVISAVETTSTSEVKEMKSSTKDSKKKTKKVDTPSEPTSEPIQEQTSTQLEAPQQTPEESETTTTTTEVVEESTTEILFSKLVTQFQDVQLVLKTLHSNLKVLQKEVLKERKEMKKRDTSRRKKSSDKKRSPSGFAKPSLISNDLSNFLGIPEGSEIARTEVTSKIIAYIKEQNLQNPENKKMILPDTKLGALLEIGTNQLSFFNLQTYLKKHFIGSSSSETTVQTTEATVV